MPKKEVKLTPKEIRDRLQEYFDYCDPHIDEVELVIHETKKGGGKEQVGEIKKVPTKTKQKPYTLSGIANCLGITTKQYKEIANPDYKSRHGSVRVSPKARDEMIMVLQKVEEFAEKKLYQGASSGAQFALKNIAEWKDKMEVESPGLSNSIAQLEEKISKALKK